MNSSKQEDVDHTEDVCEKRTIEVRNALLDQIEFYFSDANLPTDMHMLQEMKQGEGFVSISHLMSFKRIRKLFKTFNISDEQANVEFVAKALEQSKELLKLSEDRKRVGRAIAFRGVEGLDASKRTCEVRNLPKNSSVDSVKTLFESTKPSSEAVSVKSIRVNLVKFVKDNAEVVRVECATEAEMLEACAMLNDTENWRFGLRVRPVLDAQQKIARKREKQIRKAKEAAKNRSNGGGSKGEREAEEFGGGGKDKKKKESYQAYLFDEWSKKMSDNLDGKTPRDLGFGKRLYVPRRQRLKLKARSKAKKEDGTGGEGDATEEGNGAAAPISTALFRSSKGPDGTNGFTRRRSTGSGCVASDATGSL